MGPGRRLRFGVGRGRVDAGGAARRGRSGSGRRRGGLRPLRDRRVSPDVAEGEEPDPNEPLPVEGDGGPGLRRGARAPVAGAEAGQGGAEPGCCLESAGYLDLELASRLRAYKAKNLNPTQGIRMNREFNNPQILQKIVDYGIDDVASNYPTAVFDPQRLARRSR